MRKARRATRWAAAIGAGVSLAGSALAAAAQTAAAQTPAAPSAGRPSRDADVPPAYRPPPGMCRVWLAGVPPNQQPAPTDCASAVRNRPANGRVLFGDDYVGRKIGSVGASSPLTLVAYSPAVARPTAQDEYEAGYAAGYRDAMNGRRPRFRGAGVTPAPSGAGATTGYAGGYGDAPVAGGTPEGGVAVVIPPSQDPRYFNNGRYAPPGRANGVCLDRDGDGWCDDPRFGAPVCRDLDGDGRCDDYPALAAAPFPSSLPEMRAGFDVQQGRGSATALRWLGSSEVVARAVGPSRGGSPRRVLWFDANTNQLLQSWTDLDGDGVADRVEVFRNGRRVKLLGR